MSSLCPFTTTSRQRAHWVDRWFCQLCPSEIDKEVFTDELSLRQEFILTIVYTCIYLFKFNCVGSYKLIEILMNLFLEPTSTKHMWSNVVASGRNGLVIFYCKSYCIKYICIRWSKATSNWFLFVIYICKKHCKGRILLYRITNCTKWLILE
jgi:hypothetical protein